MASSEETVATSLGKAIARRRIQLGMKRKDLAEAASLSYPYVAEIENGGKTPSQKALGQLAEALSCSTSQLMADAESMPDDVQAYRSRTSEAPVYDSLFASAASPSMAPGDPWPGASGDATQAIVDELRDELRLTTRKLERLDGEVRALREELARLRGAQP